MLLGLRSSIIGIVVPMSVEGSESGYEAGKRPGRKTISES